MRYIVGGLAMLVAFVSVDAALTRASAQSCQSLWVERNSYYKAHGYCFRTAQAIRYFGNGGCYITNQAAVPLSRAERRRIAVIIATERQLGCR